MISYYIEADKRRHTFAVRWRVRGNTKKFRDEFTYRTKTEAKDRRDILIQNLRDKSLGIIDSNRSARSCAEKYYEELRKKEVDRVDTVILHSLNGFLSDKDLKIEVMADITQLKLLDHLTALYAKKYSSHTISSYMSVIRTWLKWAVKHEWLSENPYVEIKVPEPKKIDRYYTDEELLAFEAEIDTDIFRCLFRLGYMCGLRPGEMRRIEDSHVRWDLALEKGELAIPPDETKTDSGGRIVPLPAEVYELLPKLKGFVFEDWTEQRMNRHFLRAKYKAGIKDKVVKGRIVFKTMYWTRHTYAKRYLQNGGNLKVLQTRMGHATIDITANTYGHLESSAIREVVVPSIFAGQHSSAHTVAGLLRGKSTANEATSSNRVNQNGHTETMKHSRVSVDKQVI